MTTICRVKFCELCHKLHRPKIEEPFVVIGKSGYHVMFANRNGAVGFTPHLLRLVKVISDTVIYESLCGMHEHGVEVFWDGYHYKFEINEGQWERGMMELKQWNAWVKYKDPAYQI